MHSPSVLGFTEFKKADLEKEGKDIWKLPLRLGFLGSVVGKKIDKEILKVCIFYGPELDYEAILL